MESRPDSCLLPLSVIVESFLTSAMSVVNIFTRYQQTDMFKISEFFWWNSLVISVIEFIVLWICLLKHEVSAKSWTEDLMLMAFSFSKLYLCFQWLKTIVSRDLMKMKEVLKKLCYLESLCRIYLLFNRFLRTEYVELAIFFHWSPFFRLNVIEVSDGGHRRFIVQHDDLVCIFNITSLHILLMIGVFLEERRLLRVFVLIEVIGFCWYRCHQTYFIGNQEYTEDSHFISEIANFYTFFAWFIVQVILLDFIIARKHSNVKVQNKHEED